jgi:hypothetical protein
VGTTPFGGRPKGATNVATRKVKAFLDGVFTDAFEDEGFRKRLLTSIVTLSIDAKLLSVLLAYYAGRPAQSVEHHVEGTLTLAQLIAGKVPAPEAAEPEE